MNNKNSEPLKKQIAKEEKATSQNDYFTPHPQPLLAAFRFLGITNY